MSEKTLVILGESQESVLKRHIARGRHISVDEDVLEGIHLPQQRELHLEHLRQLIAEGDASGDFQEVDFDELVLS